MSGGPVRALVLDLGNVLVFHDNDRLDRELAAACGLTGAVLPLLRAAGVDRRINTTDGPPSLVYDLVAPAIGFPGTLADFAAIWNGIFRPYDAMTPVIEALHGRVPLAVLSNTNAMHFAELRERLPLLERFDAVLTSHELGLMKPEPAIYEAALARLGVSAAEAAFFDDLPGHVEGARRVGMRGYIFTDVERFTADLAGLGLWQAYA